MHGSDQPKQEIENAIKKLLVSDKPEDHLAGLEQLDAAYRDLISGRVRKWSDRHRLGLDESDIAHVWQKTVNGVAKNVAAEKFKRRGSLPGYLGKIARRRAIDLLRRRQNWEILDDPSNVEAEKIESGDELIEEIILCCDKMPQKYAEVMQLDVLLFDHTTKKWADVAWLTVVLNKLLGDSLSESAVKNRRRRARKLLQTCLKKRGIRVERSNND